MCGGSAFKAAREDSNELKKYDETGLVISSCKHCIVPYAINMFKGESWTHTAFMHNEAMKNNAKFFCYDGASSLKYGSLQWFKCGFN